MGIYAENKYRKKLGIQSGIKLMISSISASFNGRCIVLNCLIKVFASSSVNFGNV